MYDAYLAMMLNPLVGSERGSKRVLDELLETQSIFTTISCRGELE